MKQEWWKKKLREDAELHFPDSEKNGRSRRVYIETATIETILSKLIYGSKMHLKA